MNCKVIAIENQKGGTGKSTTALNLGVGLKMKGKRVLLIDADPQGSLSISLGIKRPDELDVSLATLMSKVIDNKPFDDGYGIIHCNEGIDLMPCNVELSGIESYLFTVMSRECIMRNYINQVKKNYDYILIDCTPSLGLLPINAFVAADSIIVPSQPRILSTKGLDLLLRTYSQVKRGINPDLTQIQRYIRLTNLVPELQDFVDKGKMKMRPAVELSYLDEETQRDIVDRIDETDVFPSHAQAISIRRAYEAGKIDYDKVRDIMAEEKPNQQERIVLRGDRVRKFIPKSIPLNKTEEYVCKALEHYASFLRKRAERDSR